jgi:uncharacterized repeat protein (TIGR01451 family)
VNSANNSASNTNPITQVADMTLALAHVGAFAQGGPGTYTLTASNVGGAASSGPVMVADALPAGLTPVSASGSGWSCPIAGQTVNCSRSDALAATQSYPAITLTVAILPTAAGSAVNSAAVSGGGESNLANDSATDTVAIGGVPDMAVSLTNSGGFVQGRPASFSATISNPGGAASSGLVTVADVFPAGMTPSSASGTGWTCGLSGQTASCTRSDAVGSSAAFPPITYNVNVAAAAPVSSNDVVTVNGGGETNTANDSATNTVTIGLGCDLNISLSLSGSLVEGQTGSYSIASSNVGGAASAGQVTVADTFPASVTPTAASGTGWTCTVSGQTVSCTRADVLVPGANYGVISVSVSVAANVPATVSDTATIAGGGDTNPADNSNTIASPVTQISDLTLTMTATPLAQGGTGTYTLTAGNVGGAATSGAITLSDLLPAGLTPSAASGSGWTCSLSDQLVSCRGSAVLAAGASLPVVAITVSVSNGAAASISNTASVGGGGETNTGNDSAVVTSAVNTTPDLTISLTHSGTFTQGGTSSYTITASNVGGGGSSGPVSLTQSFPAGIAPISVSGAGWTCSETVASATCSRTDVLAAGASYPAITATVAIAASASGTLTSTAGISGGGELNVSNDSATNAVTVGLGPDLTIMLSVNGALFEGQTGSYSIASSNVGGAASAGQVTVADTFPASVTPTAASGTGWTCTVSGQTVSCTRADVLVPGANYGVISVSVSVAANVPATVSDTATIAGGGDTNPADNSNTIASPVTQISDLTLTMTATPLAQGGTGTYTLTAGNVGGAATSGAITLSDLLPAGLTPSAASGSGWTCSLSDQLVSCRGSAVLAAGASLPVVAITVSVSNGAAASISNTASVGGGGETNTGNDSAVVTSAVNTTPDLTISLTHSGTFTQGGTSSYTITASNVGGGGSSGPVSLTQSFPAGIAPISVSGAGWTCSETVASATCSRTDVLAAGASYPAITATVAIAASASGTLTSTAGISGGGELNVSNDSATNAVTVGLGPDLTIMLSVNGALFEGQTGSYSIASSNVGGAASAGQVTVADTFPASVTPTAASGTGWTCTVSGQTVSCTRADSLAQGASYPAISLGCQVASNAPASVVNTATVSGGGDLNPANNSSTITSNTTLASDLTLSMSAPGPFTQGGSASYGLIVNNAGGAATTGPVTISDIIPSGVTPTAAAGSGWTCAIAGQTVTCSRTDALAAASSYPPAAITVAIASNAPGSLTNSGVVSGGGELNTGNDSATIVSTIGGVPDLTISTAHTGNFTQADPGAFTMTVTNLGGAPSTGIVTATDSAPAGLLPASPSGNGWACSIAGQVVTCTRPDALAAGLSYAPIHTLVTSTGTAAGTAVVNTVNVAGGGEQNTANDQAQDTIQLAGIPDLVISLQLNAPMVVASASNFSVAVTNNSNVPTNGFPVVVSQTLPAGVTPTQASGSGWTCSISLQTVTCQRSDQLPGHAAYSSITVNVQVTAAAPATFSLVATVSGGGDQSPANDQAVLVVTTGAPDLTISEALQGTFRQGGTGTYLLTVSNVGQDPTDGSVITMTDTLPAGLTPISAGAVSPSGQTAGAVAHPNSSRAATGANWSCSIAGQVVTCTQSVVLANGSALAAIAIVVNVAANAGISLTDTADVGGGGEVNLANDVAALPVVILAAIYPDLTIGLSHVGDFTQGLTGQYTIIVTNQGQNATSGIVTATDFLPVGLTPNGASGTGWTCSAAGATLSCSRSDVLAPAGSYPVITVGVNVAPNAATSLQDTASVQGGGEINTANDSASDSTNIVIPLLPVLQLAETADRSSAEMGDVVTFTLQSIDASAIAALNAQLQTTLPASFRYVPGSARVQAGAAASQAILPAIHGSQLAFSLGQIPAQGLVTVVYRARIGADVAQGGHLDTSQLSGLAPTGQHVGPVTARVSVNVNQSSMLTQRPVIGRVYVDTNSNSIFDAGDVPVPGARVYLSDGQSATTDSQGLYSIPSVGQGSVAISLDTTTMPVGYVIDSEGERQNETPIRLLRTPLGAGVLLRQNFALRALPGAKPFLPAPQKTGPLSKILEKAISEKAPARPAQDIRELQGPVAPGEIVLLSPLQGETATTAKINLIVAVAKSWKISINANGHHLDTTKLRPAVQESSGTATYTLADLALPAGPNTIRVAAVGPHGEYGRHLEATFHRSGSAKRIEIVPASQDLVANGHDATDVRVLAYDAWDKPAADELVTVETSRGRLQQPGEVSPGKENPVSEVGKRAQGSGDSPALDLHSIGAGAGSGSSNSQFGGATSSGTTAAAGSSVLSQAITGSMAGLATAGAPATGTAGAASLSNSVEGRTTEPPQGNSGPRSLSLKRGEATLRLQSSYIPGSAEISAYADDSGNRIESHAYVAMTPELRRPILVAVGELSFGHAAPEQALFNESGMVERRTQFFYRGTAFGSNAVTFAYSSHSPLNDTSGYNRMFEMDPTNQQYLLFGDSSTRSYNALSNSRVYARIDHRLSYLMFGDLRADAARPDTDASLTSFERSITGLKLHLENRSGAVISLTGARPNSAFARDVFPGNSLGLITLSHSAVLVGSQVVTLETRDRRSPAIVLSRETLVPTVDYTMDASSGSIFFLRTIAALDASLNLTQIVVDYEYQSVGLNSSVYTARAEKRFDSIGAKLGVSFLNDRQGGDQSYILAGIEAEKKLPNKGLLTLEAPISRGDMTVSGTVDPSGGGAQHNGTAIRADLLQPLPEISSIVRANFSKTDANFLNPFGATVVPGQLLTGVSLEVKPESKSQFNIGFLDERNHTVNVDNHRASISAGWKQKVLARVDLRLGFDHRNLTDSMANRLIDSDMLTLGADWRITGKLQTSLQREQNLRAADPTYPTQTVLSAKYQISPQTRLFYTERLSSAPIVPIADLSGAGFAALNTTTDLAVGIETKVRRNTNFGARYEIDNGINGADAFAVLGFVNRLPLGENTSLDFGLEHGLLVNGKGHDFNSETTAISWRPKKNLKISSRYELRDQLGFASLATAGAAGRIASGVTVLGQLQFVTGTTNGVRSNLHRAIMALAIRPLKSDRAGFLFSYNEQSGSGFAAAKCSECSWRRSMFFPLTRGGSR